MLLSFLSFSFSFAKGRLTGGIVASNSRVYGDVNVIELMLFLSS